MTRLGFSRHSRDLMLERGLDVADVASAVDASTVDEEYEDDATLGKGITALSTW